MMIFNKGSSTNFSVFYVEKKMAIFSIPLNAKNDLKYPLTYVICSINLEIGERIQPRGQKMRISFTFLNANVRANDFLFNLPLQITSL